MGHAANAQMSNESPLRLTVVLPAGDEPPDQLAARLAIPGLRPSFPNETFDGSVVWRIEVPTSAVLTPSLEAVIITLDSVASRVEYPLWHACHLVVSFRARVAHLFVVDPSAWRCLRRFSGDLFFEFFAGMEWFDESAQSRVSLSPGSGSSGVEFCAGDHDWDTPWRAAVDTLRAEHELPGRRGKALTMSIASIPVSREWALHQSDIALFADGDVSFHVAVSGGLG